MEEEARSTDGLIQVSLNEITVRGPRRNFNIESKIDNALVESIKEVGVVEPALVQKCDSGYILIAGERRVKASIAAGLKTIPVRIFSGDLTQKDILLIQMIENIQRENPDPITEAQRYYEYLRNVMGCSNLENAIEMLILFGRGSSRLSQKNAEIFSALVALAGKSSRTIQNLLYLLKLPRDVQDAIANGKISLSQGYLLSRYIHHVRFNEVVQERHKRSKMTNAELISQFESDGDPEEYLSQFHEQLKKMKKRMEKENVKFEGIGKEAWLREIETLRAFVA